MAIYVSVPDLPRTVGYFAVVVPVSSAHASVPVGFVVPFGEY